MAEDVFALLRKRREAEELNQASITDELVVNANKRRLKKRRETIRKSTAKYRKKPGVREHYNEWHREYRKRDDVKAREKKYREEHKDMVRASNKKCREKKKEADPEGYMQKQKAHSRKMYAKHHVRWNAIRKEKYKNRTQEEIDNRKAYQAQYRAEHKEELRAYQKDYRLRKKKEKEAAE